MCVSSSCYHNERYDQVAGSYAWARETLAHHAGDPRPHLYTLGELEAGVTYDELWNASQLQLVIEGKMV